MATTSTNPFMDFDVNKMMGDFKWPGMDVTVLADTQRKNMEAMTAASRLAAEGMQAVMKRQMELARQGMEDMATVGRTMSAEGSVNAKAAQQTEMFKDAYVKAVSNMREMADLVAKSNTEAFDTLSRRFTENLDEVSGAMKNGPGQAQ